ncbi:MAG: vitamin K epoxide reductase family protein [Ktedonobacteraceae bacterium]|nr:vitamin K epoxide reductase family protein [Ktedonobacteraceae bacterium]
MAYFRRSGGQIAMLALSILGVMISIYLTITHYDKQSLICSSSGLVNCERVLSSSYSVVPGTAIPISIPGLLWFCVLGALAFCAWRIWPERRSLLMAEVAWSSLGLLTVLYLVYAEIVRLDAICAWCTSLHVIILLSLIISVFLLSRPGEDEEMFDDEEEEEAPKVVAKRR